MVKTIWPKLTYELAQSQLIFTLKQANWFAGSWDTAKSVVGCWKHKKGILSVCTKFVCAHKVNLLAKVGFLRVTIEPVHLHFLIRNHKQEQRVATLRWPKFWGVYRRRPGDGANSEGSRYHLWRGVLEYYLFPTPRPKGYYLIIVIEPGQ